jgi:GNAT superfamily N-acetyltransferase
MIRHGRPEDMGQITHVRISVVENHLSIEGMAAVGITREGIIADMQAGHYGCWVAEEHGTIVAFSMADRRDGSIFALFTLPGKEGRGYGTRLLAEAERWLVDQGMKDAWLSTGRGTVAEKFYARRGWVATDETAQHPEDVVFRKRLSRSRSPAP